MPATPAARTDPLALLGPEADGDLPSRAPGPVDDAEVVRVGLAPDGSVQSVRVDQRLTVHGLGDFDMKVLGPALDVIGAPGASPRPGLRQGTVIWQGFSPGTKELVSTVVLPPEGERDRLPIEVRVDSAGVTLVNRTAAPIPLAAGEADVAAAAAAVNARLAAGQAPVPGRDGVPAAVSTRGPARTERRPVVVPMHVVGAVGSTPFDVVVGAQPVAVAGAGAVAFTAVAALPAPGPMASLLDLSTVLTQVARVEEYRVYLGVSVPGPSTTSFEYGPEPARRAAPRAERERADWTAVGLSALAALLLAVVGRAAWARS